MKIAVLIGSPRKQNCFNICKEIELNIGRNDINYDYIYVNDYKILDCKGCSLCFKKSEKLCPCNDDIQIIKDKLKTADGIIFTAPVYAYQVPAPLKRVIDRMAFLFHRQELAGKPTLIVVTSDGGGHKQVSRYLKMTLSGWACKVVGYLNIISPLYFEVKNDTIPFGYNEKYHNRAALNISKLTKVFIETLENQISKTPSFYDIFMFNCLRGKTFVFKSDYDYWNEKNWLNSNYFYDTKLNPFKKVFGIIVRISINFICRKMKDKMPTQN